MLHCQELDYLSNVCRVHVTPHAISSYSGPKWKTGELVGLSHCPTSSEPVVNFINTKEAEMY